MMIIIYYSYSYCGSLVQVFFLCCDQTVGLKTYTIFKSMWKEENLSSVQSWLWKVRTAEKHWQSPLFVGKGEETSTSSQL